MLQGEIESEHFASATFARRRTVLVDLTGALGTRPQTPAGYEISVFDDITERIGRSAHRSHEHGTRERVETRPTEPRRDEGTGSFTTLFRQLTSAPIGLSVRALVRTADAGRLTRTACACWFHRAHAERMTPCQKPAAFSRLGRSDCIANACDEQPDG